jgi:hypothetical protein
MRKYVIYLLVNAMYKKHPSQTSLQKNVKFSSKVCHWDALLQQS